MVWAGRGMCLLDTQVQRPKINWDPKDNKAGGHQCASIARWVVFLLSLRKTELVGVVTILRPREVTFRQLFPRDMTAVWAKHSIMLLLSKGKIRDFLFLCSWTESQNQTLHMRAGNANKQTKTYKNYIIFQKELSL